MSRNSITRLRIGVAALGLIVAAYLTPITVAYIAQLDSPKRIAIFSFLWLLGLGAMVLLIRAWRHFAAPAPRTSR